jgi:DNA-binding transcriptional LysR family regulator
MIWPEFCADALKSGALCELAFHPPWLRAGPGIIYRRSKPLSAAAQAFCDAARSAERDYFRHRPG